MANCTITSTDFNDTITTVNSINSVSLTSAAPEVPEVPEGCMASVTEVSPALAKFEDISEESVKAIEHTVYLGVMPTLVIVGLVANSLNIAVFYRMGIKRGINLCLLLLSLSDVLFLLTQTAIRLSRSLLALAHSAPGLSRWDYTMVTYHLLKKGEVFLFFSSFLTTVASLERCVSIVSPLKARIIFSFKTVVAVIIAAFIVAVSSFVAIGFKHKAVCIFNVREGVQLWGMGASSAYLKNKMVFDTVYNLVLVFAFPVLSLVVVIVSTAVIIHQLNKATRWRRQTSSAGSSGDPVASGPVSNSEAQLHKILIAVSCIYVACTLPSIVKEFSKFLVPGFSVSGNYSNLFNALVAIKDALASINCTFNFFVYYSLGSHFRRTLNAILGRKQNAEVNGKSAECIVSTVAGSSVRRERLLV